MNGKRCKVIEERGLALAGSAISLFQTMNAAGKTLVADSDGEYERDSQNVKTGRKEMKRTGSGILQRNSSIGMVLHSRFTTPLFFLSLITFHSPFSILTAAPFVDNADGTVTDNSTNLRWQKCSYGQTNNSTCSGTALTYSWQSALNYCNGLSLVSKAWRLPSVSELKSLVKHGIYPAIDIAYFPGTVGQYYWSATTRGISVSDAWGVWFSGTSVQTSPKASTAYVRCVTNGP